VTTHVGGDHPRAAAGVDDGVEPVAPACDLEGAAVLSAGTTFRELPVALTDASWGGRSICLVT